MFFLTQAVVAAMAAHNAGVVINIASNHAYTGMAEHSVYAGTKGSHSRVHPHFVVGNGAQGHKGQRHRSRRSGN